jgi:hypothetical protein
VPELFAHRQLTRFQPAKPGDMVLLLGQQQHRNISTEFKKERSNTNAHSWLKQLPVLLNLQQFMGSL